MLHALGCKTLLVAPPALPFLCRPSLHFVLIRVLCRIKNIHWKLQEEGPLQEHGHPCVQRRWKGDEYASPLEVSLVLRPMAAFLVSLLRGWALLQRQAGHEHEKQSQEPRPKH